MPDICTLLVMAYVGSQCFSPPICTMPENGRVFCAPPAAKPCPATPPVYECRRPDGATYTYVDNTATLPRK